jgi:hypothetical protein
VKITRIRSYNDKLLCRPYEKKGAGLERTQSLTGFSTVKQKNSLHPLEVVVDFMSKAGDFIPKGSLVYVLEEVLTTRSWSDKTYEIDGVEGKVIVMEFPNVIAVGFDDSLKEKD